MVIFSFVATGLPLYWLCNSRFTLTTQAYSSGPPAGFTHAPGEVDCSECHVPDGPQNGQTTLTVPATYVPGQTYQITVHHINSDPSRKRWGFELTVLDDSAVKAGNLQSTDNLTLVLNNQGPGGARQYIEHTTLRGADGTFFNQLGGATWTFNWTAPPIDAGRVTFYVAGNQANGDLNTSGDMIHFTFAESQPAAPPPQLRLEQNGPSANQAAALDAVLLLRDPFHVQSIAPWFNPSSDQNTRVMVFAANLPAGSVSVSLVDAHNQPFEVAAEDVRAVANSDFSQITFRLPDNLAEGTCTVTVKVGSLVSNAGTIRIVP